MAGPYPELVCAFGHFGQTFAEIATDDRFSSARIEVNREQEGTKDGCYVVGFFFADYPYPSIERIVDPAQGYMVVAGSQRNAGEGWKTLEYTVAGREVRPGVWFPTQWRRVYFGEPDPVTGQQSTVKTYDWDVTELKVDPDVPDSQFEWTSLGLGANTEVWRTDVSGELTRMKVVNDELVPISLATGGSK